MSIQKDKTYLKKIGEALHKLRSERQLLQKTVASDLEIRQETLSNYETKGVDSITVLAKFAEYYKVDMVSILSIPGTGKNIFSERNNIFLTKMLLEDQHLLLQLINKMVVEEFEKRRKDFQF